MNNIDKLSIVKNLIKIAHNHKLSLQFRDSSFELWDKFLNNQHYSSTFYSNQELDYQTIYYTDNGSKFIDLSLFFLSNNDEIAIWPLCLNLTKDNKIIICSQFYDGISILAPNILTNLNHKLKKRVIECCLSILDFLAKKFRLNKVNSISTFTGEKDIDLWFYENFKRGCSITPEVELLVDLSLNFDEIKSFWTKSTKSDIQIAKKTWKYKIFENIDKIDWDDFKNLHFELAGKKTRSDKTWESQIADINNKNAFAIHLYDKNNKFVGGSFFRYTSKEAIYSSGVYRRELFNKPLGHYTQQLAIQYMQKMQLKWYKIGHISADNHANQKEKNISFFKTKFNTDRFLRFNFEHSYK